MKQEDNWSAKFREKMSDYSLSAPDEVWEELEKELSSAKIVKIRYCRLRAIAAVILLFLLSSVGVYIIMNTAEEKDYPVELSGRVFCLLMRVLYRTYLLKKNILLRIMI